MSDVKELTITDIDSTLYSEDIAAIRLFILLLQEGGAQTDLLTYRPELPTTTYRNQLEEAIRRLISKCRFDANLKLKQLHEIDYEEAVVALPYLFRMVVVAATEHWQGTTSAELVPSMAIVDKCLRQFHNALRDRVKLDMTAHTQ